MPRTGWEAAIDEPPSPCSVGIMSPRILAALPVMLLAGCGNPLCTTEQIKNIVSPDGSHNAVMFMRECGATTDFTTQVSVDPSLFQSIGNVFVADGYNGGTRGEWGGPWADVTWTGPSHLLITYDGKARIFDQQTNVNGVTVTYRSVGR